MQTGALLALYRQEECLTQVEAAESVGCTQSVFSKWQKNGIPMRQRERVLDRILPPLEEANNRSVIRVVNASQINSGFLAPDTTIRAISTTSAACFDSTPEELIGRPMREVNTIPEVEAFFWHLIARGMFQGKVLQAFLDGVVYQGVNYLMRVKPVGIYIEGSQGCLYYFTPSAVRPDTPVETFQEAY